MKKKAIIHIGGSLMQLPGILAMKELGLYTVVTDKKTDCPGKNIADRFELISGSDTENLMKLAKQVNEDFELIGAFSTSDFGLKSVAEISYFFRLKGHLPSVVNITSDKSKFSDLCHNNGIMVPRGFFINNKSDIDELGLDKKLPLIFKPINSCGSQGVKSVYEKMDLIPAYENARRYSEKVIVEELITGKHLDVNGFLWKNVFYPCGILERFFSKPPYHYPTWGFMPSFLNEKQEKRVYDQIAKVSSLLGINYGPIKGDTIWTQEGPVIIEISTRFHGDVSTQKVVPLSLGFNPVHDWFYSLLNDHPPQRSLKHSCFAGWRAIFSEQPGIISEINGVEKAKEVDGISEVMILKNKGQFVEESKDTVSICGFVWAMAKNQEDLDNALQLACTKIKIRTETSK